MTVTNKINKTVENILKRKLSIQFSLDGFSFCASNHHEEVYFFATYKFTDKSKSPDNILENLKKIFNTEKALQEDFDSVFIIHENSLNTFVPNAFFNEHELKNYLKFSVKTIATDLIVFDDLEGMKNVYVPYVNINNFLFQNFGEFEYRHHASILVEKLLEKTKDTAKFYVNVNQSTLDIIFIENGKLMFYNSFDYQTKEDLIYYVLFSLEQLMLDPNDVFLHLIGEIDEASDLYKMIYTYIRNIRFVDTEHPFLINTKELSNHSHYILLK